MRRRDSGIVVMCGTFINQVVDEIPMVSRVVDVSSKPHGGQPR